MTANTKFRVLYNWFSNEFTNPHRKNLETLIDNNLRCHFGTNQPLGEDHLYDQPTQNILLWDGVMAELESWIENDEATDLTELHDLFSLLDPVYQANQEFPSAISPVPSAQAA